MKADAEDRTKRLLEGVLAVSSGMDLEVTLRRVVQAAVDLVDARYGALGMLGGAGETDRFVYVGIDAAAGELIGPPPAGTGVLGVIAKDSEPLRLDDVRQHPVFAGFPPDHPTMRTFLGAPIRWGGEVLGRLYVTDKADGQGFTDDDEVTVKAVAGAVGMAVTYAREFEQARQGRQWLEAAGDVTTELLGGGHTDRALTMIAGRAMELSAADTAMVLVPSDPGIDRSMVTDLRAAVCVGAGAGVLLDLMIPVKGSIAGAVLADQQARKVGSLAFHPNNTAAVLGPAMLAPLTPDSPAAVLVVARAPGSAAFDDNDLTRLTAFAENAALALHLAQTERHRELRVLADRDRVARGLYDHVMQQLFAVGLALQITRRRPPSPNADSRMGEHIDEVQQVIREVRQAIFDLPPALTDPPHLRTSLTQLITSLTADAPQLISVRMTGPLDDLPDDLAQHTRGVLREAIGNALRHSHADDLSITITVTDELIVEVTDDGIGTRNATEGNGLRTLRQRATDVAGTFTIDRPDTGGTHLVWTAPLP